MIVVLDTNVIISALLSPKGTPAEIIRRWEADEFEVPYGAPVAGGPVAPVAAWLVVVLVLAFVVQVIAALFVMDNSVSSQYGTATTESLNLFRAKPN